MNTKDPYYIDPEESAKFQTRTKGKSAGIVCPKWNFRKECKACEFVQQLFNTKEKADREEALERMAKVNIYMCGVLAKDPNKLYLFQLGKLVGSEIVEGTKNPEIGWTDITHPKAGHGRCIKISKSHNGKHNVYKASIDPNKADWDIPNEVMAQLPDLEHIVDVVESEEVPIYNIADMEKGETLTIRLCPDVKGPERNNRFWVNAIWRHWGFTQDEIDGTTPIRRRSAQNQDQQAQSNTAEKPMWDAGSGGQTPWNEESPAEPAVPKRKRCFGNKNFYDTAAPECKQCPDMKACGREVVNS